MNPVNTSIIFINTADSNHPFAAAEQTAQCDSPIISLAQERLRKLQERLEKYNQNEKEAVEALVNFSLGKAKISTRELPDWAKKSMGKPKVVGPKHPPTTLQIKENLEKKIDQLSREGLEAFGLTFRRSYTRIKNKGRNAEDARLLIEIRNTILANSKHRGETRKQYAEALDIINYACNRLQELNQSKF